MYCGQRLLNTRFKEGNSAFRQSVYIIKFKKKVVRFGDDLFKQIYVRLNLGK